MATITLFENIVATQIMKVPTWARVTVYLLSFIVLVYMTIFPKFIDGEVRVYKGSDFEGSYQPFIDADIGIKYHGRPFSTPTSVKGDWSLPMLDSAIKVSGDIDLRIEYTSATGEDLFMSVSVPRSIALMDNVLIGYNESTTQKFKLLNKINTESGSPDDQAKTSTESFFINSAYAQERYQKEFNPVKNEIENLVKNIRKEMPNGELSYSEKKVIQADIEEKYKIKLNSVDVKQSKSVDDLTKLSVTKIISKSGGDNYAYYGSFDGDGNWSDRFFDVVNESPAQAPQVGDIVKATGSVNIRSGYIEYSWLKGWENKPVIGVVKADEEFLIEEVKLVAGDYVWVKLHQVD